MRSSRLTQPVKQSGCPFMAGGPPPSCKVGEWILPFSHHLSPSQQGIPGWSGPLGGREGLDQHAPWGGQASGPQPTFEKQVRLRVIQSTSQLCRPRAGPWGLLGPNSEAHPPEQSRGQAHGQPRLPLGSLPGGCPAGRGPSAFLSLLTFPTPGVLPHRGFLLGQLGRGDGGVQGASR